MRTFWFIFGVWIARHIFRRHELTGPEILERIRRLEGQ